MDLLVPSDRVAMFSCAMELDDLVQALKDAAGAVDRAGVPEDLRELAFGKALDVLVGVTTPVQQMQPPAQDPPPLNTPPGRNGGGANDGVGGLAAVARRLRIDQAVAANVFDIDDEGVHVVVPRGRLHARRNEATREILQLVIAARQAAGLDQEWTSVAEIRVVAEAKGVLDASNFASTITSLDGQGMRFRGPARGREIKMNDAGFEAAGQLAQRLVGQE